MYSNHEVVVIVLDYNRPDLTNRCLESIWRYNRVNIVLVNSGSGDYSEYDKNVPFEYIVNRKGRSFSVGMNTGIKAASAFNPKYIIFMNNDAIITEGALRLLVVTLESNPKIGMVSSGYKYSLGYLSKEKRVSQKSDGNAQPVLRIRKRLTGFCLCAKFEIISKIGGYDENFIFTKEDDDLSYRIVKSGFILAEVENSVVMHKISSSIRLSEDRDISFLSLSFGFGCGLLVNKKERNVLAMLIHLFIQNIFLFVKTIVLTRQFKVEIFKWSLQGFKNGFSKRLNFIT